VNAPADVPRHRRSVPFYVGAGGIATAGHYATTVVAVELLGLPALAATTIGFAIGAALKYWLNYTAAFRSSARHSIALVRFLVALLVLMGLNAALFALLQRGLGLHYMIAQAIATVALLPPGYLLHRYWVFKAC
jgi:putative flippase GtrA